jgi:Tol biopolymer transport system component
VKDFLRPLFFLIALCIAIAGGSSASPGTFPGGNGLLVFDAVDSDSMTVQIFEVGAGGTGLKQLTKTTGAVWNEDPSWSANGRTIFFDSFDRSKAAPSHIYRMSANGTGRRLVDKSGAPADVWPSANRSGSALAVVQFAMGGQGFIATMKANGAGRRVIANATRLQNNGSPEYAPSGTRIAFSRVTYNKSGQGIAKADLLVRNGGRNTVITKKSTAKFYAPSWAPNGKGLVAVRGQRTIVTMRPNGTGMRVLASISGAHTTISSVVYSPDGTKIAYLQCKGDCGDPDLSGQGSIWVMNANGSGKHAVFTGGAGVQPATRVSWGVG